MINSTPDTPPINPSRRTLNQMCPFSNRSTRFFSSIGKAPELGESREANFAIMRVLNKLADEVKQRNQNWSPVPINEYNKIAEVSHRISEHSPSALSDVFPVPEHRTVEYVFQNKIEPVNTTLGNALSLAYLDINNRQSTRKATAKYVLGLLQKKFTDFVKSGGKDLDLSKSPIDGTHTEQGSGVIISKEDFELLLNFQDLQERFETDENVRKLNDFPSIIQIAEIILGIQLSIVETLKVIRKENPGWFNDNSLAFEEIAILDENNNIVPSSRLLKLVIHNIGEYVIKSEPNSFPETVLFNALQGALKNNVFHQKILIFDEMKDGIRFDGVIDKVCPARNALSQIIINQLTNRIIS